MPVPAHPAQNVVRHRHWSIAHRSTIRTAVPDTFKLNEGLWPLLCHASQLSQTLVGFTLQGIHEVPFGEERQPFLTASASAFRAPQSCKPLPFVAN